MRRRAEWSGAAAAAAVGAMITGHFIPHWKTERVSAAASPVGLHSAAMPAGRGRRLPPARHEPHILKHVDREGENEERDAVH